MKNIFKIIYCILGIGGLSFLVSLCLCTFLPFPFERTLHRTATIIAAISLPFIWTKIFRKNWTSLGLIPSEDWYKKIGLGMGLGLFSASIVICLAWSIHAIILKESILWPKVISSMTLYFISGLAVAFFEEIFFRGMLLQLLSSSMRLRLAVITSSIFYSLVHFLKYSPEPLKVFMKFGGLFLVGIILARAFLTSKTLYVSIGLHAAWVFVIRSYKLFFHATGENFLVFGDNIFIGGVLSWILLIILGLGIHYVVACLYQSDQVA